MSQDVGEAIRKITALLKEVKQIDIRNADVGEHLNPGDVYDAYQDINRTPVVEHVLQPTHCGPFAAVFLQRHPSADESKWNTYVEETFHEDYVIGFLDGFRLCIPESVEQGNEHFLRGVYDGVMANAAVF